MSPPTPKPVIVPGYENEPPVPSLQRIVRNSALLNLVIVLTSFPVLAFAGGPKGVVRSLKIEAGISVLIWTATFALFSLFSLPQLFRRPVASVIRRDPSHRAEETGVADRWLDGPV
jgi:hypothetical protein